MSVIKLIRIIFEYSVLYFCKVGELFVSAGATQVTSFLFVCVAVEVDAVLCSVVPMKIYFLSVL